MEINDLSIDILKQILDIKSLNIILKCNLVCKKWNYIINKHLIRNFILDKIYQLNNVFDYKRKIILDKSNESLYQLYSGCSSIPTDILTYHSSFNFGNGETFNIDKLKVCFIGYNIGGDRVIYMNDKINSKKKFLFKFTYKNNYIFKLSNIYYFEIIVDEQNFREPWENSCISVGFA